MLKIVKRQKQVQKKNKEQVKDTLIDLLIYVESAKGLLDLREICRHAMELDEYSNLRLAGIVFGSDDFCANIGATRTDKRRELLYARQYVVLVAKWANIQAIDSVYIDYQDTAGLEKESQEGLTFGFTGKQAIHPTQVPIIQKAFSPTEDKIQWAKGIIEGFRVAQKNGKGAFVYNGQMVDMPLLRQAAHIMHISKQMGKV